MEEILITRLSQNLVDDAVEVLTRAYVKEPIMSYLIDLSNPTTKKIYSKIHKYWLNAYIEAKQPVMVASQGRKVVGLAVVKENGFNIPIKFFINCFLPRVILLTILRKIKLLRLFHLQKLLKIPQGIPRSCYILEVVAVHPDWQGRGVGHALLDNVNDLCRIDKKFHQIYLYAAGEKNQKIYEHLGYQNIESVRGDSIEIHHMVRPLDRE